MFAFFPYGVSAQVRYLFVSISDIYLLFYFGCNSKFTFSHFELSYVGSTSTKAYRHWVACVNATPPTILVRSF